MRWPWQRRGRRRRTEAVAKPVLEQWAPGWAETFLPQSTTHAMAKPILPLVDQLDQPVAELPSTVRLGFSDGSELELDESSGESQALRDIAATLTRRSSA